MDLREIKCDGMEWRRPVQDRPVAGSCEHGNELSGSTKDRISSPAGQILGFQEELHTMQLIVGYNILSMTQVRLKQRNVSFNLSGHNTNGTTNKK
jgi:hypothetical protein